MDDKSKKDEKEEYSTTVHASETVQNNLGSVSIIKIIKPIFIKVMLFLIVVLLIFGIVIFLISMPGLTMGKLKLDFSKIGSTISAFYGADTNSQIKERDIYAVLDYLEEMGYDLKGYGFLTDYLTSEESTNGTVDSENGVVRNDENKIIKAKSDYIMTYIISDNYVYTLKNDYLATKESAKNWFESSLAAIPTVTLEIEKNLFSSVIDSIGDTDSSTNTWGKGLIALYHDTGIVGKRSSTISSDTLWDRNSVKIDTNNNTMLIKENTLLNMDDGLKTSLEGWKGKFGMPLELLLSIHMSTMMPDLSMDIARSFPTNVNIYLHDKSSYDEYGNPIEIAYTPYIASVTNHWFRNIYFVLDENHQDDANTKLNFVSYDSDYEAIMKERWTLYETYTDEDEYPERNGMFKLYVVNEDGSYGDLYDGTEEEAKTKGIVVQKKAKTISRENEDVLSDLGWNNENGLWTAYKTSSDIKQVGEAQRTQTNSKIKKMFSSNKYFRYDGTLNTAEIINKLRKELKTASGKDMYYTSIPDEYMNISKEIEIDGETIEYKVKDYASSVSLNQDSLNAFSMLENTHTVDSDYIYRDLKELSLELGYYTKEEVTDETPRLLQWIVPRTGSFNYPKRYLDKLENEYGTLIHSKGDIDAYEKEKLVRLLEEEREAGDGNSDNSRITGEESFDFLNDDDGTDGNTKLNEIFNNSEHGFLVKSRNVTQTVGSQNTDIIIPYTGDFEEPIHRDIKHVAAEEHLNSDGYGDIIEDGGVEYKHYLQYMGPYVNDPFRTEKDGGCIMSDGCGPTSCATLLSGYGLDVTPADVAAWADEDIYPRDIPTAMLDHWGIETDCVHLGNSSQEELVDAWVEAFNEGKPVICGLPEEYPNGFWTVNGHYLIAIGIDEEGRLITGDPASMDERKIACEGGLRDLAAYVCAIWIPKEPPSGFKGKGEEYKGYIGNEAVVSPVTGLLLEYGTYKDSDEDSISGEKYRTNVDYKYGKAGVVEEGLEIPVDKVGYAKILVLNKDLYSQLEKSFYDDIRNIKNYSGGSSLLTESGDYVKDHLLKEKQLNDDNWTDKQKTIYAYKEFVQNYERYGIDGYIVYIDGFVAEYPDESQDSNPKEGNFIPDGDDISFNETFKKITNNSFDSNGYYIEDEKLDSLYEHDDKNKLISNSETDRVNAERKVKVEAMPAFYTDGKVKVKLQENNDEVEYDGVFIKEGTVIGRTMTDKELMESEKFRNKEYGLYDEVRASSNRSLIDNPNHVIGNYLRIIMMDEARDNVENVEDYMKLDTGIGEDDSKVPQEYKAWDKDLEMLAAVLERECCARFIKQREPNLEEAEYVCYCMGYSVVNKVLPSNYECYGKDYYDPNNTEWSPLYQVLTNKKNRWYGGATLDAAEAIHNGQIPPDGFTYCDECLEIAEFCLTYDCTSVTKPTKYAPMDGGRTTIPKGEKIPKLMVEQGLEGGAWDSAGSCIVGFFDYNQNDIFDKNDEVFAVPKDLYPYWTDRYDI